MSASKFNDDERISPVWACDKCAVGPCIVATAEGFQDKNGEEIFKPNNNCPLGSESINYADFVKVETHDLILVPKKEK